MEESNNTERHNGNETGPENTGSGLKLKRDDEPSPWMTDEELAHLVQESGTNEK